MDFSLSSEQRMIVETVRRFVRKEIWLSEKRIDTNAAALPPDVFGELQAKVRGMGLDNLLLPPEFGAADGPQGPALDAVSRALLAEETSQHRAGVLAPGYGLFGVDAPPQLFAGTKDQQQQYLLPLLRRERRCFAGLTDPAGASHPTDGLRIRARRMDHEWMLDGTKIFVSGAENADFGIVFANTEDEDGTARGASCFIVDCDRVGFQRWRSYPTMSAGRDTMELNLSNLRLPPENLLGEIGEGAALANDLIARRRIFTAAQLTGISAAAQDMARQQVSSRREFGAALAAQQGARWALADNEADLRVGRLLTLAAADRCDRGAESGVETIEADAGLARVVAGEAASRVVDRTIQLHGGPGVSADLPLERWYRELRVRRIDDGGSEMHRAAVTEHLLTTYHK